MYKKEPYIPAKEAYIPAKEPYIHIFCGCIVLSLYI